jgi:peptidoglycan-associated lipoprotein
MKAVKITLALILAASMLFAFTSCTCKPGDIAEEQVQPKAMETPAVTPAPKVEKPAVVSTAVLKVGNRIVDVGDRIFPIYFDFDKAELRDDARATLSELAQWLKDNPSVRIRVDGNCDERGSNEYNLALGENRAASAKKYLVYLGISPDRLETMSYGEEKPVCTESNESCWSKNRRDNFTIIAK